MSGHHKIAWQRGQRAIYADVTLSLKVAADRLWHTEIPLGTNLSWAVGVHFGIEVFRGGIQGRSTSILPMAVVVTSIKGQTADTTSASVAFATFHALWQAAGIGDVLDKVFSFNADLGSFVISQ